MHSTENSHNVLCTSKVAQRLDCKCSQHKNEMIIVWHDSSVS